MVAPGATARVVAPGVPAGAAVAVTGLAMARCHRRWSWWWAALGLLALANKVLRMRTWLEET